MQRLLAGPRLLLQAQPPRRAQDDENFSERSAVDLVAGGAIGDGGQPYLRRRVIRTVTEAEELHNSIATSAALTVKNLAAQNGEPMEFLPALRFDQIGHNPLSGEPLNIVEQINQTFTIIVTLRAIEVLLKLHPDAGAFRVALGTSSGRDIESIEENLVAPRHSRRQDQRAIQN